MNLSSWRHTPEALGYAKISAKKTYLKIVEIGDHETEVEIVSQQENMASINGKIVELVVGS